MKRYLRIYKRFLIFNFLFLFTYRANFINSVISSVAWGIFSILTVVLLTSKTPDVFGWTREELLILTGCYGVIIGFFHMFFSRNFDRFARIINRGELDLVLTKPLDSQFLLSTFIVNYTSLLRVLIGIIFVLYMVQKSGAQINALQISGFVLISFFSITLLYSIWFIVITFTVWFNRLFNLADLMFTISSVTGKPAEMYRVFSEYLFLFLLPLIVIVVTPARFLIRKMTFEEMVILMIFSLSIFYISRIFWKFALRFYTSAGG